MLQDLAVLTGATVITPDLGMKLESATMDQLGKAKKIISTKDNTTVVDGDGDKAAIEARVAEIQKEMKSATSEYDKEKLAERMAKLGGGVAVIKVGAATEVELKEKKHRIEDAVLATKAASEEGIVAGGGTALLRASKALDTLKLDDSEAMVGVHIVQKALEAPVRQIATNSGFEASVVVNKVLQDSNAEVGFNAVTGDVVNLVQQGIIDPKKVTRSALQNAASIAGVFLTTEAAVVEVPEDKKDAPAMGGMPGGMGGMGMM